MEEKKLIRVGNKAKKSYVNAVFFCLSNYDEAVVRGLGCRQGKVMEIADEFEKINDVEVVSISGVSVNESDGLEIVIKKREGGGDG